MISVKRLEAMEGFARISAQTTQIDRLLSTRRVAESAVLTSALQSMKREILLGLRDAIGNGAGGGR